MPRPVNYHKVDPLNNTIGILASDDGTSYTIELPTMSVVIPFQHGQASAGLNGVTSEALIAVLVDRHEQFQRGKSPCEENRQAMSKLSMAIRWMRNRTARLSYKPPAKPVRPGPVTPVAAKGAAMFAGK